MDRNSKNPMISVNEIPSLSARRAWIEIETCSSVPYTANVALRKESVDRNPSNPCQGRTFAVALRKESVDRNVFCP